MISRYFPAWFGLMVTSIASGGIRDKLYKPYLGDLPVHQESTFTLIVLLAEYFRRFALRWPLRFASPQELGVSLL